MQGALLAIAGHAALAGHAASQHLASHNWASQPWAGTYLSAADVYWFSLANVVLLALLFAVSLQRRRLPVHRGGAVSVSVPVSRPGRAVALPALRASDAEREATATVLAQAIAEGRLTLDEGVERIDRAYRARDRSQLATVTADLPWEPPEDAGRFRAHRH